MSPIRRSRSMGKGTPKKKKTTATAERKLYEQEMKEFQKKLTYTKEPWYKKGIKKFNEAERAMKGECSKCRRCEKATIEYIRARDEINDKISRAYETLFPIDSTYETEIRE